MAASSVTPPLGFEGGEHGFLPPKGPVLQKDFWTTKLNGRPVASVRMVKYISPKMFWLQNRGKQSELKVKLLNKEMTKWYSQYLESNPRLTQQQIVLGGVYAAYWSTWKVWVRVRVVLAHKSPTGVQYTVQALDYGTVSTIDMNNILPLREVYNKFPVQVVRAKAYDENDDPAYTFEERKELCTKMTGKTVYVIVLAEDKDNFGCPLISVIISHKNLEVDDNFETIYASLETLNGRFNFSKFADYGRYITFQPHPAFL